jgi:hypothetical protein
MAANVIGLIELEATPEGTWEITPDGDEGLPPLSFPTPPHRSCDRDGETTILRADLNQLKLELNSAFADLMRRLLQGD